MNKFVVSEYDGTFKFVILEFYEIFFNFYSDVLQSGLNNREFHKLSLRWYLRTLEFQYFHSRLHGSQIFISQHNSEREKKL